MSMGQQLGSFSCTLTRVALLTICGPSSFTVPELDRAGRACDTLNAAEGLLEIVKVRSARVLDVLRLPVSKSIDEPERM